MVRKKVAGRDEARGRHIAEGMRPFASCISGQRDVCRPSCPQLLAIINTYQLVFRQADSLGAAGMRSPTFFLGLFEIDLEDQGSDASRTGEKCHRARPYTQEDVDATIQL